MRALKLSLLALALSAQIAFAQGPGRGGPGPSPAPNPWIVSGATISYGQGGVALPSSVTGGGKGVGTINVQGYFLDGAPAATTVNGQNCALGSACTITASAGTVTFGVTVVAGGNGFLYNNTAGGPLTALSPVINSVLSFNGSGTPLASTTLPSGLAATNMVLTTPNLGTPSAVNLANGTNLPLASITGFGANVAAFLATPSSANLAATVTGETGTGALVFGTSPTIATPSISSPTITGAITATGLVKFADMATAAIATSSQYLSGAASVLVPSSVIYTAETTTTFSSTPNFDFSTFINTAITMTGNVTSQTLSNVTAGKAGSIAFIQDGTGSRTTTWNSIFKFPSGITPTLTTTPNAIDVLFYSCRSATNCPASLSKDIR